MFKSTKTYGTSLGLSCCFRQWKAKDSHCSLLHGYSIGVKLTFEAEVLDERNWVMDFGGLAEVKQFLGDTFDHTMLIAEDDPHIDEICGLAGIGVANVVVLPCVGCEAFAAHIYHFVEEWLFDRKHAPRVALASVEVFEHGANSAIYTGEEA